MGLTWAFSVHFSPRYYASNELIRLFFVVSVIDGGTPQLDATVRRFGTVPVDRSEHDGHVYMDKAPGLSFLVLPWFPLAKALKPSIDGTDLWIFGYLACLWAATLPMLGATLLLGRWLLATGVSARDATCTLLALGLASPVWIYATLLFGHALAAAGVAAGVFLLARDEPDRWTRGRVWLAGLCLGWAGLTETPVFLLVAVVCGWALVRAVPPARGYAWAERLGRAGPVLAGVSICALLQLGYNEWLFGDPLRFAYQFKADPRFRGVHAQGMMGISMPRPEALHGLWLSARRGLLYHAPWLGLAGIGHLLVLCRPDSSWWRRFDAGFLLIAVTAYALLIAGFVDWPAGDAAGARHLLPIVPLLASGLGAFLARVGTSWAGRGATLGLIAVGVALAAPTVMTLPYHAQTLEYPVFDLSLPLLFSGQLSGTLARLVGWSETAALVLFLVLVALPWLAGAWLWPAAKSVRLRHGLLAGVVAACWIAALSAAVPPPDQRVWRVRERAVNHLTWSAPEATRP